MSIREASTHKLAFVVVKRVWLNCTGYGLISLQVEGVVEEPKSRIDMEEKEMLMSNRCD